MITEKIKEGNPMKGEKKQKQKPKPKPMPKLN